MTEPQSAKSEYLVLSLGQWDELPPEEIQRAIDEFYVWLDRLVAQGRAKRGQRLASEGKRVSRTQGIRDGPFSEAKEVVGGYWTFVAESLEEAAALAAENPCMRCGLYYEIRPIDPAQCSAYAVTTETPAARRAGR
jgi:hypothetical protein